MRLIILYYFLGRWLGKRDDGQGASYEVSTYISTPEGAYLTLWLPDSVELAGVNMRLDEGAIRELHWHKEVLLLFITSI